MARTIKVLLPNVETEIYRNWNDRPGAEVKAVSISVLNNSATDVKVHLGFVVLSGLFLAGAIASFTTVPAYTRIPFDIEPRIIAVDESIRAWAEVPNVISLSIDLVGDINQEDTILDVP